MLHLKALKHASGFILYVSTRYGRRRVFYLPTTTVSPPPTPSSRIAAHPVVAPPPMRRRRPQVSSFAARLRGLSECRSSSGNGNAEHSAETGVGLLHNIIQYICRNQAIYHFIFIRSHSLVSPFIARDMLGCKGGGGGGGLFLSLSAVRID